MTVNEHDRALKALGITDSPILGLVLPRYMNAAGYAAAFELRVRLLADHFPALSQKAASVGLDGLVKLLLKQFPTLPEADVLLLSVCADVRNNLFHLKLSKKRGKLVRLGEQIKSAQILRFDLETGESKKVNETSTESTGVCGWLLESGGSGDFETAIEVFLRGMEVLNRMLDDLNAGADVDGPGK